MYLVRVSHFIEMAILDVHTCVCFLDILKLPIPTSRLTNMLLALVLLLASFSLLA